MRLRRFLPVLILLFSLLTACAPAARRDPFAYAESSFSREVEGFYLPANDPQGSPRPFAAIITAGVPQGGDMTKRELSVAFTSPETLAGVTVTSAPTVAADGALSHRVEFTYPSDYGSVHAVAKGNEPYGLLRFALGWIPTGDVTEISPQAPDGSYTVTRTEGGRVTVFTFGAGCDFPVTVKITDERGTVDMTVK